MIPWLQVWPTSARDLCNLCHWRILADGTALILSFSEKFDEICPREDSVTRAEQVLGGYVLKPTSSGTSVYYIDQVC